MLYAVKTQGSYVNDLNLRAGTKNGTFWASYTPDTEELNNATVWVTSEKNKATGLAMMVDGEVVEFIGKMSFKEV